MIFVPHAGYQEGMIWHVFDHRRSHVFARMGAGKTPAVLTALDRLTLIEEDVFPAIVLAPKRVAINTWPSEVHKWDHLRHLRVRVIDGTAAERKRAALTGGADIYCMAYDNIPWLMKALEGRWYWPTVICDESTRLKGLRLTQGSKRAQALSKIAHTRAKRWVNLAGIPAPNGLQDLWGPTWFLDRGKRLLHSYTSFCDLWFYEDRGGKLKLQRGAEAEIAEALKDITVTVDPRKFLNAKEPTLVQVPVKLPAKAMDQYKAFKASKVHRLEETGEVIKGVMAAALSMKLRQFANGFLYREDGSAETIHEVKLDALESIVEEQAGAPLLVSYYFKEELAALKRRFPQARELDAKKATEDAWNRGEIPILLAHPKSAGHGLNLQHGGCDIAYFSHDWNMEEREQILERIGPTRQAQSGHDRVVTVYDIVAEGTIDPLILARTRGKVDVNEVLLRHLKGEI